jgi:hypothetical protein
MPTFFVKIFFPFGTTYTRFWAGRRSSVRRTGSFFRTYLDRAPGHRPDCTSFTIAFFLKKVKSLNHFFAKKLPILRVFFSEFTLFFHFLLYNRNNYRKRKRALIRRAQFARALVQSMNILKERRGAYHIREALIKSDETADCEPSVRHG